MTGLLARSASAQQLVDRFLARDMGVEALERTKDSYVFVINRWNGNGKLWRSAPVRIRASDIPMRTLAIDAEIYRRLEVGHALYQ